MVLNYIWIALSFILFAVVHSLTAGNLLASTLKQGMPARVVDGWYRLAYNAFSLVSLAPVLALVALLPDSTLFALSGIVVFFLRGVQLIAFAGLIWTLVSIDFWRFAGLRQVVAYVQGLPLPLPDEILTSRGIYGLMRHPLYVFSLLFLWASPAMTINWLAFNVCATLYFLVGAAIEERRLVKAFGDQYELYRRDVGVVWSRREVR